MFKRNLLLLVLSLNIFVVFGQNEANNWYFGYNAGLSFSTDPPTPLTNGALVTGEGSAVISDVNGNLLFYTDGSTVWNANHVVMPNGTGLLGNSSSAQSAIIIPKPGSLTNYYIITVPVNGTVGMRYSEVDMTLDGGLGGVLPANKNTFMFQPSSEKVTAIKHANGVYYWVVGRGNSSDRNYYSFLIDCEGVNLTPVISSNVSLTNGENWGYLVGSPDGTKIASASSSSGIEIADFDNSTGLISNNLFLGSLNYSGVTGGNYGIAFSSNSTVLYASSIHSWALVQWDLTAANIPLSNTLIGYTSGSGGARPNYRGGALQLAKDGKIYVAETGLSSLGVINSPNTIGTGCNFVNSQVSLGGRVCRLGLPPFMTSLFMEESEIITSNECVDDSTHFSVSGAGILDSLRWNFGDPSSPDNESNLVNSAHVYSSPGQYTITLIRYLDCISDTTIADITIHDYRRSTRDISLCRQGMYTLPGGGIVSQSGTYYDTISSQTIPYCDSVITTIISIPDVNFTVSDDDTICRGQSTQLLAQGAMEYSWQMDPSLSADDIPDPIATPLATTTYYVTGKVRIGNNLVENGDFENGNTDFSSGYMYGDPDAISGPGYYTVNTGVTNTWWPNCGDHTSGAGNALIADGADGTSGVPSGTNIWCQNVLVEPNTEYAFSLWLTNANSAGATSLLDFSINGAQIGATQQTLLTSCQWNEFYVIWNSGSNTVANICVSESSGTQPGNDFAIDDISLYKLCDVVDSVTIVVSDPQIQVDDQRNVTCFGLSDGSVTVSSTGGFENYSYSWDSTPVQNTATASGLPVGGYTVTVVDRFNCSVSESITITEPDELVAIVSGVSNASCFGSDDGTIEVGVTGGTGQYIYSWDTTPVQTTYIANNLEAGSYTATVTDENNCSATVTQVITEPTEVEVTSTQINHVSCFGLSDGSATVEASGGTGNHTYVWNTNPVQNGATANGLSAGTYQVTVTDENNCTSSLEIEITEPDDLLVTLTSDEMLVCPGENVTLSAVAQGGTSGYTINWNNGLPVDQWSPTVTMITPETYLATVTDQNQCSATASITIDVVVLPVANFNGSNLIGCAPLDVQLNNLSTGVYATCEWEIENEGVITDCGTVERQVNSLGCHDVTLTLYTVEGCSVDITMDNYICVEPQPVANFSASHYDLTTLDTEIEFTNQSLHATNYEWDFGDEFGYSNEEHPTYVYSYEESDVYLITLIASNNIGCADTTYQEIRITEEELFYVPNTFTPDGDKFNPVFKPVITSGVDIYDYRLLVFNRWGEILFESYHPAVGWDGTYGNMPCQDGTYIWQIEMKSTESDKKKIVTGHVNLLR